VGPLALWCKVVLPCDAWERRMRDGANSSEVCSISAFLQ
jgi:hypothetical protein